MELPTNTPPERPEPLSTATEDGVKRLALHTAGAHMDEQIEENYKNLPEQMNQGFAQQMARFEELTDAQGRYRAVAAGKPLIGALIHAKGQRPVGHPFPTAKEVAKSLDDFCGSKSWEKALNLEDSTAGGTLVRGEMLDLFFGPLRANSVVFSLNPVRRTMIEQQGTLTGFETDPQITWVGEVNTDQEIVDEGTTGNRAWSAKDAMLATPVGNALLASSLGTRVAREVEEQIQFAYTIGFDIVLITGVGTVFRPKGIRNWALPANEVPSSGLGTLENIFDDFRDAFNAVETLNVPMRNMGIIWSPRSKNHVWLGNHGTTTDRWALRDEVAKGSLFGVPWRATTTVPNNLSSGGSPNESYIIFADFSQIVVMEGPNVQIARSGEASWTENGTIRNPREQKVTVFWSQAQLDTVVPHPEAVYVITDVTYGV